MDSRLRGNDGKWINQRFLGLFALSLLFLPGLALGAGSVTVSHAWIRLLPGKVPLAGYVTLHNHSARKVKLVGAASPAFKRVQFHRSMTMRGGMETMKRIASVTVPAHGTFSFAPGNYHIMLWRKKKLKVGDKVPVILKFADGSSLRVQFTVKGATAQ